MHQQRIQSGSFTRQYTGSRGIEQARQFWLAFCFIHCSVRSRVHDDIGPHAAHRLRQRVWLAQVTAQRGTATVQSHDITQHRQAALQLPADLAMAA